MSKKSNSKFELVQNLAKAIRLKWVFHIQAVWKIKGKSTRTPVSIKVAFPTFNYQTYPLN